MKLSELKARGRASEWTSGYSFTIRSLKQVHFLNLSISFFFYSSTLNVQIISPYIQQQWITTTDSVGSSLRQLIKGHATLFISHTVFIFFSAPLSFHQSLLLNHKHEIWSSFWTEFQAHDCGKNSSLQWKVYIRKNKVKISTNHKSEGTTKAQKLSCLLCSWSIYFFGMHRLKNSWGWHHNKCNKYWSKTIFIAVGNY